MKVNKTSDYSRFVNSVENRDIRSNKKLLESMSQYGFSEAHPIHVRLNSEGKLEIRDGHHRFEIAKFLKIPLYYVVSSDQIPIERLNASQKPWSMRDYVASFVKQGKPEYIALNSFANSSGIPLSISVLLLAGYYGGSCGNHGVNFKAGNFRVKNGELANRVAAIVGAASKIIPFSKEKSFVMAVAACCLVNGFSAHQFIEKVAKFPHMLTKQAGRDAYLEIIESVYNYASRKPIPLAFSARSEVRKRNTRYKNE